jgi:hypothetical protein
MSYFDSGQMKFDMGYAEGTYDERERLRREYVTMALDPSREDSDDFRAGIQECIRLLDKDIQ